MMKSVGLVFGTRPEAIKLAPVIRKLLVEPSVRLSVINSGQHSEILEHTMTELGIQPDISASIISPGQDLATLMSKGIAAANEILRSVSPDLILVHGDTTTAASFATAAFTRQIDVHHVEAGLRTHTLSSPFPEEFNRQLIARVARANYAPTSLARDNLLQEGIASESIFVTGNTAVDSVAWATQKLKLNSEFRDFAEKELSELGLSSLMSSGAAFGLITLHRRENAGGNFHKVLGAVKVAATLRPNFNFVFPVHPNPIIREPAAEMFSSIRNVHLCRPMKFAAFSLLLKTCDFIISDSGGIQEEAVSLRKPTILARLSTERPEGLMSGYVKMPALDEKTLSRLIIDYIDGEQDVGGLNLETNPFGDGMASHRIVQHIISNIKLNEFYRP